MSEVTFTIKATMEERWVNHFLNFLKRMELDGAIGHSELIGFYADGDGDFQPQFVFSDNVEMKEMHRVSIKEVSRHMLVYDAG